MPLIVILQSAVFCGIRIKYENNSRVFKKL